MPCLIAAGVAAFPAAGSAAPPAPAPTITEIPRGAGTFGRPWGATNAPDFRAAGWSEREFTISGRAVAYARVGAWRRDGRWGVREHAERRPYATRVLVRRPTDPSRFNGTVVVEWNNVSAQFDTSPDWGTSGAHFIRDGYAWVGVSAQQVGVTALRGWDRRRYGGLRIPSDAYSYDIYSQVARVLRQPGSGLLGDLSPSQILGTGHSQSAGRLITYANAVQPVSRAFDGLLIHGRFGSAPALDQSLASALSMPSQPGLRADSAIPILQLESETDILKTPETQGYLLGQPDHEWLRTWEVAGTAHIDRNTLARLVPELTFTVGLPAGVIRDPSLVRCSTPQINTAPFRYVENAAFTHLRRWAAGGAPPPSAPFVARTASGAIARDQYGNALGGIRLPELEVPVARYWPETRPRSKGDPLATAACALFGGTTPFTRAQLAALYPTNADYMRAYRRATDALIASGFMLAADREDALDAATARRVP